MKWYRERLEALEQAEPVYSVCGDDCSVCPRLLAQTPEERRETAEFWYRVGWRDRVVSDEEITCGGCGSRGTCSFMILPCLRERGLTQCRSCGEYPCRKLEDMLRRSDEKERQCLAAAQDEDMMRMLRRAYYEKRRNLGLDGGKER